MERLLPIVLALDLVYVHRASLRYDATVVARTLRLIASAAVGRRTFPDPPELSEARRYLYACRRDDVAAAPAPRDASPLA